MPTSQLNCPRPVVLLASAPVSNSTFCFVLPCLPALIQSVLGLILFNCTLLKLHELHRVIVLLLMIDFISGLGTSPTLCYLAGNSSAGSCLP